MLPQELIPVSVDGASTDAGTILLRRGQFANAVVFVESGRVALGLMDGPVMTHQLGMVQGPSWLEASAAILQRSSLVDAVAQTPVTLRRLDLAAFRRSLSALPASAQTLLHDVALAHWQQSEFAVSRLAKDAEARCAEWLLRHLRERSLISGSGRLVQLDNPGALRSLAGV